MMEDRNFVFLGSYLDAIEQLPEDMQLDAIKAIVRYGCDGVDPEAGSVAAMAVALCRNAIDKGKKTRAAKAEAGRCGMAGRWKDTVDDNSGITDDNTVITNDNTVITDDNSGITRDNEGKGKGEREKEKDKGQGHTRAGARFVPPTVEEVAKYCRERGNDVDPKRFVDHYTTTGWMRGNNRVKDWRACVRTWERREDNARAHKPERPPNQFHNFDERKIDYDAFLGRGTG